MTMPDLKFYLNPIKDVEDTVLLPQVTRKWKWTVLINKIMHILIR